MKTIETTLDNLIIKDLENLVEAQRLAIDAQREEIAGYHRVIDILCKMVGIEPPKWEG